MRKPFQLLSPMLLRNITGAINNIIEKNNLMIVAQKIRYLKKS